MGFPGNADGNDLLSCLPSHWNQFTVDRKDADSRRNKGLLTQIIRKGTPFEFQELSQGRKLEWVVHGHGAVTSVIR